MRRASGWMARNGFRHAVVLPVQCAIVLLCVAVTTVAAMQVQQRQIRAATEERVLDVARSLAALDQVHEAILDADGTHDLQPLADLVEEASGVDYVVITDARGIRLTHPDPAESGRPVSTDPAAVLAGETFLGTETGTIGATLRAKVPVRLDGAVIGTASVGVLESEIAADHEAGIRALAPWVLISLIVGCMAAAFVSHLVGLRVRRLEAGVAELDTQRRLTTALREQTHEFHTRLHAVYGLVESGAPQEAMDYIAELVPVDTGGAAAGDLADPRAQAVVGASAQALRAAGGQLVVAPLSSVDRGTMNEDDLSVLSNLLRNAVEATDGHGQVRLRVHADATGVEMEVSDDGPGIPVESRPQVFRRGFTTKRASDGTPRGIGLALVQRVVRARGGQIEIGGSQIGGARVAVTMPSGSPAAGDRATALSTPGTEVAER